MRAFESTRLCHRLRQLVKLVQRSSQVHGLIVALSLRLVLSAGSLPAQPQIDLADTSSNSPLTLPGTAPLDWQGDITLQLVEGVDRFLLKQIEDSVQQRSQYWHRDTSSRAEYERSVQPNRERFARITGAVDQLPKQVAIELVTTLESPSLVATSAAYEVHQIRWRAFGEVYGEGLLLKPTVQPVVAQVIAIPHTDVSPEQLCGLKPGVERGAQYARMLAEAGCQVVVPVTISRAKNDFAWGGGRKHQLTNREFLYRPAFELGRHLIGYEVQKVLALVQALASDDTDKNSSSLGAPLQDNSPRIGVVGWGDGGLLAMYASALDHRIDVTLVSGYFGSRQNVWQEPIDRNVFGLLREFGDAEIASLIAPRDLLIDDRPGPTYELPPGNGGGAPARLVVASRDEVKTEFDRALALIKDLQPSPAWTLHDRDIKQNPTQNAAQVDAVLRDFVTRLSPAAAGRAGSSGAAPTDPQRIIALPDATARLLRQMQQLDRHSQDVLRESPYVRREFMKQLDATSLASYRESVEAYREFFRERVIGKFDLPLLPPQPRTRLAYHGPNWDGWEVVLDVFPDVFAYGVLLVPRDIPPGEQRPVVVCQHGLEGRPENVIQGDHWAYHDYAAKLAERGFITFAPQNLYIFEDQFRTLQRKANSLRKTMFSVIVPQHQQIVDWLQNLPQVDPERIAFYGLSYGGKSAMRIPPLVTDYCLSICSADFNEWVDKNASTRNPHSYVWGGEYEIFEFDLGSTFNYAEMAALIAPRPFMVERGHFDGVASDETVAHEFAKVRFLYAAQLKLPERCDIEFFDGPHTINGQRSFDFLHRHLYWPEPTLVDGKPTP